MKQQKQTHKGEVVLSNLTIFTGLNGTGKSTIIKKMDDIFGFRKHVVIEGMIGSQHGYCTTDITECQGPIHTYWSDELPSKQYIEVRKKIGSLKDSDENRPWIDGRVRRILIELDKIAGGVIRRGDGDISEHYFTDSGEEIQVSGIGSEDIPSGIYSFAKLAKHLRDDDIDVDTMFCVICPETRLHPSLAVKMISIYLELARTGFHIAVSTYSPEILKFIEVAVEKEPNLKDIIALNHFTNNGINGMGDSFSERLAQMKQELTKPFSNLYMEGLL